MMTYAEELIREGRQEGVLKGRQEGQVATLAKNVAHSQSR